MAFWRSIQSGSTGLNGLERRGSLVCLALLRLKLKELIERSSQNIGAKHKKVQKVLRSDIVINMLGQSFLRL